MEPHLPELRADVRVVRPRIQGPACGGEQPGVLGRPRALDVAVERLRGRGERLQRAALTAAPDLLIELERVGLEVERARVMLTAVDISDPPFGAALLDAHDARGVALRVLIGLILLWAMPSTVDAVRGRSFRGHDCNRHRPGRA